MSELMAGGAILKAPLAGFDQSSLLAVAAIASPADTDKSDSRIWATVAVLLLVSDMCRTMID